MADALQSPMTSLAAGSRFRLGRIAARPRAVAIGCIVVLTALGWLYVATQVAGMVAAGEAATLGPGMAWLDPATWPGGLDGFGRALLEALCGPAAAGRMPHAAMPGAGGLLDLALVFPMWCAMTLAMMLPTAAPMVLTYADIAETALRKGEPVVSPAVLVTGYAAVWIGFALVATALQAALIRTGWLASAMGPAGAIASGAVFIGAGLYQFSALKHACMTKCGRPFPFFFANWTDRPAGVFRLGLRQGLYCVGCCVALMLVMFAVGVMNVVWMAGLGIVMAIEKMTAHGRFSHAVGAGLIAAGAAIVAVAAGEFVSR